MEDRRLRRAGLDYREFARVQEYEDLHDFQQRVAPGRVLAFTTQGSRWLQRTTFAEGDALLFGPETRGLPASVLESIPVNRRLRIPMVPGGRSLNLSNAVAVAVYEAWRQLGLPGADGRAC